MAYQCNVVVDVGVFVALFLLDMALLSPQKLVVNWLGCRIPSISVLEDLRWRSQRACRMWGGKNWNNEQKWVIDILEPN